VTRDCRYEDASVTSVGLGGEYMNLDDGSLDIPGNFTPNG